VSLPISKSAAKTASRPIQKSAVKTASLPISGSKKLHRCRFRKSAAQLRIQKSTAKTASLSILEIGSQNCVAAD